MGLDDPDMEQAADFVGRFFFAHGCAYDTEATDGRECRAKVPYTVCIGK